jgi:hypothetical protein
MSNYQLDRNALWLPQANRHARRPIEKLADLTAGDLQSGRNRVDHALVDRAFRPSCANPHQGVFVSAFGELAK